MLGGFGRRSRKGMGAVAIQSIVGDVEQINQKIGMTAHLFARSHLTGLLTQRFASPTVFSTLAAEPGGAVFCIVTQLHCTQRDNTAERADILNDLERSL
jgi:hypothetical protein